jgi:hypothetical protein
MGKSELPGCQHFVEKADGATSGMGISRAVSGEW